MDSAVEKSKFGWSLLIVPLLCLVGAAGGGYVLYTDLHDTGESGGGKTIAKVERRQAKVRRKAANSYIWNNVAANQDLYLKDSIQTGRGSAVTVKLQDGSLLDIGENSLIVMDDSSNLSLGYLRGSVVVHKAEGDSKISVGTDGKTRVEELPARLIKPESLARFFVPEKELKQIVFGWQLRSKNPTNDPYTIQISADKRFYDQSTTNINVSGSIGGTQSTQSIQGAQGATTRLGPGRSYWRLVLQNKVLSETRQFQVYSAIPLQSVWPGNLQKVTSPTADSSLAFRWVVPKASGGEEADLQQGDHRIEVARDPGFRNMIVGDSINPTTGTVTLHGLPDGNVYWRIKSIYGDVKAFSVPKQFEFKTVKPIDTAQKNLILPFPELVKPDPGAAFNLLEEKTPPEASWSDVQGASEYEVTVYSTPKGSSLRKVALHLKTGKTRLSLKELPPGDYIWTLRSIDPQKHLGTPLPMRGFTLGYGKVLAPPQVVSPEVQ